MTKNATASLPAFDKLYEHSSDAVLILAEDGRRILDANPRAAELMGLDRGALLGKDIAHYLSNGPKELPAFAKAIHNHGVIWTDTFSWPMKDKGPTPVDVSASGFETPKGQFIMLVIHESVATPDAKLRAARTAKESADYYADRMARFAQSVLNQTAHDIRTPITPMLLQLAVLERSLAPMLNDRDRQAIETIRRNIERLENHVQDVLRSAQPI